MATILFVDDDEMERFFARELLEPRGHEVFYAPDGETALAIVRKHPIEIVVTDLAMPRLNGLRLIKQLRDEISGLKVIAASGINADQLPMAEDFGADAVLQKPWDPGAFLQLLDDLMHADETRREAYDAAWPADWDQLDPPQAAEGTTAEADADAGDSDWIQRFDHIQDDVAGEVDTEGLPEPEHMVVGDDLDAIEVEEDPDPDALAFDFKIELDDEPALEIDDDGEDRSS